MKISRTRNYIFSLESVAITDIVLNMFIFFFISFSLLYTFNPTRIQKMEVKLPQATNTKPLEETDQIDIIISEDGPIYLNQEMVTINSLPKKLKEMKNRHSSLNVVIRAERLVPFKSIVKVLDIVSGLGITRISIAAIKE
ncbi:MAG: biopolymer transporter ExbD [Candidatus Omnitrophica bacterium]|nr:biopolymer transporter ExbD [Candidatus Omnitrophota bacterium]MCM8770649.1 biopolymer transporter ExbD [Candidatus Omnitrophota bacterium]